MINDLQLKELLKTWIVKVPLYTDEEIKKEIDDLENNGYRCVYDESGQNIIFLSEIFYVIRIRNGRKQKIFNGCFGDAMYRFLELQGYNLKTEVKFLDFNPLGLDPLKLANDMEIDNIEDMINSNMFFAITEPGDELKQVSRQEYISAEDTELSKGLRDPIEIYFGQKPQRIYKI